MTYIAGSQSSVGGLRRPQIEHHWEEIGETDVQGPHPTHVTLQALGWKTATVREIGWQQNRANALVTNSQPWSSILEGRTLQSYCTNADEKTCGSKTHGERNEESTQNFLATHSVSGHPQLRSKSPIHPEIVSKFEFWPKQLLKLRDTNTKYLWETVVPLVILLLHQKQWQQPPLSSLKPRK